MIKLLIRAWAKIYREIKIWWYFRKLMNETKMIKKVEVPDKHIHHVFKDN